MGDWPLPTIRLDRCTRCGLCVEYCPTNAVGMINELLTGRGPGITHPRRCSYCGICEEMCPVGAIALTYEIVFIDEDIL